MSVACLSPADFNSAQPNGALRKDIEETCAARLAIAQHGDQVSLARRTAVLPVLDEQRIQAQSRQFVRHIGHIVGHNFAIAVEMHQREILWGDNPMETMEPGTLDFNYERVVDATVLREEIVPAYLRQVENAGGMVRRGHAAILSHPASIR